MRLTLILLCSFVYTGYSQNGYIRFNDDSLLTGYIRFYTSPKNGEQMLELWKTKSDKSPLRISKSEISEYAIKKDTFRILRNLKPFETEDFYFKLIEAKLIQSGKIELLSIENPYHKSAPLAIRTGNIMLGIELSDLSLKNLEIIKLLHEPGNGYIRGVPLKKEMLADVVLDFIPGSIVEEFVKVKRKKISHRNIDQLVKYYNSGYQNN